MLFRVSGSYPILHRLVVLVSRQAEVEAEGRASWLAASSPIERSLFNLHSVEITDMKGFPALFLS